MKIINEQPPVLQMILDAGMKPTKTTIYTYGDTIYIPNGSDSIPDHVLEHESIHTIQQGSNPDAWWQQYVNNPWFRIDQEAEAYGHQYTFICKTIKDRNRRNLVVLELAQYLASPMYGKIINQQDARRMILNKSNVR